MICAGLKKVSIAEIILGILLCLTFECSCEEKRYDFIVVGAGSSGSVMANRLTENGQYSVLLLEQGGYPTFLRKVPAFATAVYFTPTCMKYQFEPQENVALGLKDQRIQCLRAKGLGGSSVMNYMLFTRGHREDYDRLEAMGNPGWSFKDVLPHFKKYENAKIPSIDPQYRSTRGEVDVVFPPFRTECGEALINGSQEIGIRYNPDYNTGDAFGVSYYQTNQRNGIRCDTEKAFLEPIYGRQNLKVQTHSLVTRLLIDEKTKTVIGVEYEHFSIKYKVYANVEVVLCAGALGSPKLLMLSGIGPKDHLQEMGIKVIKDLPVGQTMYDHLGFFGLHFTLEKDIASMFRHMISPIEMMKYLFKRDGHLTKPAFAGEGLIFVKTPVSNETIDYPDAEVVFFTAGLNTDYGLTFKKEFSVSDKAYNAVFKPIQGKPTWCGLVTALHPRSKGYLKLRSTNPKDHPRLFGNYLSDPEQIDVKTTIAAIRIVQKISDSPTMQRYGSKIHFGTAPGCEKHKLDSDEYWECQIRHLSSGYWHNVGTCKMGPKNDKEAVVDHKLRVRGIKKVRVADISILPKHIAGHPNSAAMMIGEKGAAMILKDALAG